MVVALLLSGCAKAGLNTPIQNHMNAKFSNAFAMCRDGEYDKKLQAKINELLEKGKIKGAVLQINCEVSEFIEGSRALRYFVGFGAGKGSSKTKVVLIDTATNKNIANFDIEGY